MPLFPGTWGSLPTVIIFGLMLHLGSSIISTAMVMAFLVLAGSFICVKFAPFVIEATGNEDPGEIVADEIAGQAITFLAVLLWHGLPAREYTAKPVLSVVEGMAVLQNGSLWIIMALGFFFFRLFDAVKPFPVHKAESLPKGWGILADDISAGVYAAIALLLCIRLWM